MVAHFRHCHSWIIFEFILRRVCIDAAQLLPRVPETTRSRFCPRRAKCRKYLTIGALVRMWVGLTCYAPIRPFPHPLLVCSPPGARDDGVSELALTRNREFTLEEKRISTMGRIDPMTQWPQRSQHVPPEDPLRSCVHT